MGCKECVQKNEVELNTSDVNITGEKKVVLRAAKRPIQEETENPLDKFLKELNKYGEKVSEDEFNNVIGELCRNDYLTNPYIPENQRPNSEELIEPGPIKLNNGTYYFGQWNPRGQMDGQGQFFTNLTGKDIYIDGQWAEGILQRGKVMSENNKYVGELNDGELNGQGKLIYSDGTIYEGDFVNGKRDGHGHLTLTDGTEFWGEFKNDEIGNDGEFKWPNGITYKGSLKNGIFDGNGVLENPNISKYNGEFKNGIYDGKGVFEWIVDPDNKISEKYDGEYSEGKKNGSGIYTFEDGGKLDGDFLSGEIDGDCYYLKDGYKYYGQYQYNNLIRGQLFPEKIEDEEQIGDELTEIPDLKLKDEDFNFDELTKINIEGLTGIERITENDTSAIHGDKFELVE